MLFMGIPREVIHQCEHGLVDEKSPLIGPDGDFSIIVVHKLRVLHFPGLLPAFPSSHVEEQRDGRAKQNNGCRGGNRRAATHDVSGSGKIN